MIMQPAPQDASQNAPDSATPSRLLTLPLEIITMILRELLWDPEPLFFHGDYAVSERDSKEWGIKPRSQSLHTRVLRVCKQLFAEGEPILYDNTIKGGIGLKSWLKTSPHRKCYNDWICLHERYNDRFEDNEDAVDEEDMVEGDDLEHGLMHKVRKVHLEVLVTPVSFNEHQPDELDSGVRTAVCEIAQFMSHRKHYQHLSFSLRLCGKGPRTVTSRLPIAERKERIAA
jgi:hypothetical protein